VGGGGAPTGAPENLTFPNALTTDILEIAVNFDNVGETGVGTQIEVQVSKDAGATYTAVVTVDSDGAATNQTIVIQEETVGTSIKPLTDYKIALRYVRGGLHSVGYTSTDPEDWPAISTGSTTTVSNAPFWVLRTGGNTGLWTRNSELVNRIINTIVIPTGHESLDIEVEVQIETDGSPVVQDLGDGTGPPDTVDQIETPFAALVTLAPGTTVLDRVDAVRNRENVYRARFVNGANIGAFGALARSWAGPDLPTSLQFILDDGNEGSAIWQNTTSPARAPTDCPSGTPPGSHNTEFWSTVNAGTWNLEIQTGPFSTGIESFDPGASFGDEVSVAVRHKVLTCSGGFGDSAQPSYSKFTTTETEEVQ
jgi:hypothetical protein